jgi:hypothetical protein
MARATNAAPLLALVLAAAGALAPARAIAGPFTDELSKCLVEKTTDQDKTLLVQWIFSTMATHPDVQGLATVATAKREDLSRRAAKMFEVLLVDRCNIEAKKAVQYEGQSVFGASFEVLGRIAGMGLFSHPTVARESAKFATYVDQKRLQAALAIDAAPAPAASAAMPVTTPAPAPPPASAPAHATKE